MAGFGNISNIMKQAQKQAAKMQQQIEEIQRGLKERVVEGSAGGGMVVVNMNCQKEPLAVKIDPEVVNKDDVEMLQDLVLAAFSQAYKKAQEIYEQEIGKITGGLSIPGLM
jgi:DNA-binding YbaB/EbfC family protein